MTVIFLSALANLFAFQQPAIPYFQSPTVNNCEIILPVVLATTRLRVLLKGKALAQATGKLNTDRAAGR